MDQQESSSSVRRLAIAVLLLNILICLILYSISAPMSGADHADVSNLKGACKFQGNLEPRQ